MTDDAKIELCLGLRDIAANFGSVCLLSICQEFCISNQNPGIDHHLIDLGVLNQTLQKYSNFVKLINDSGLSDVHNLKPLLDGKSIQVIYNCKPGKHMGGLINECLRF